MSDRKLVKSYERLKDTAAKARLPFDKDVWLNVAFYLNEHYVEWVDASKSIRRIDRPPDAPNQPRPVVNKIMHFVSQSHASALQDQPTVDVLPASDSVADISAAEVARAYARYVADQQVADLEGALSDAVLWALVAGEGFLKWIYNPRLKRPDIMSCSPLDIFADPYVTNFSKARYIIHSQFMDVEQVYELFGKEVKAEEAQRADDIKAQLIREMGQAPVLSGVTVNELWMKPCRRYPKGVYAVWTARELLVPPMEFPYQHEALPFTQIGVVPRPGSWHYMSPVTFLRSPQMELNKYHAQKIAIREAFANPKWWIPNELELNTNPNDNPRGQVLRGHSMGGTLKPEIIAPSGFPDNGDGEWIVEEMQHVIGLHEVSQAQVPGRVEAAKAIELLKESDVSRLSELRRTMKAAISEGMWQLLMLAKQYEREEVIVQSYSREGVPEVRRFKTDKWDRGMRVIVTMGTGLARSRAARQDQVFTWWQNGLIRDPELAAELMEIPLPTMIPHKAHDIRLARNENLDIAKGIAIEPNSWDNHDIHIREHNNFRKTAEYVALPEDAKTKFEHHVSRHEDLRIVELEKMLQMRQLLMAAGGGEEGAVPAEDGSSEGSPPQQGEPA